MSWLFFDCCRIHIAVTLLHTANGMADQLIKDITNSIAEIMKNPKKPVEGEVNNTWNKTNFFLRKKKKQKKRNNLTNFNFVVIFSVGILWCRTDSIGSYTCGWYNTMPFGCNVLHTKGYWKWQMNQLLLLIINVMAKPYSVDKQQLQQHRRHH